MLWPFQKRSSAHQPVPAFLVTAFQGPVTFIVSEVKFEALEGIFDQTMAALGTAREQMFDIAESARQEYERLSRAVLEVKAETESCIALVDQLEAENRRCRLELKRVSMRFGPESEALIRAAYERAEAVMVNLGVARERERLLRKRRDELERSLLHFKRMLEKAETMVTQVSVAMEYLQGNLAHMSTQVQEMKTRTLIGERVIRAQEDERRRVAREIHDGPAQSLAHLVLRAELCERLLAVGRAEVQTELTRLKDLVKECLRELRKIIFNLRPMALDDLGLVPTLRRYLEDLHHANQAPVHFSVRGSERRLAAPLETALFRTVQEAVTNAHKHAQAKTIQVTLEYGATFVTVRITDDGVGFDPSVAQRMSVEQGGFGLMSMRERIELMGGELVLQSMANVGTRVTAHFPVQEADNLVQWGEARD